MGGQALASCLLLIVGPSDVGVLAKAIPKRKVPDEILQGGQDRTTGYMKPRNNKAQPRWLG
ncbi:hypothetical protein CF70_009000 [Cupriavidus sp. SK-3]|nr:hypothetical protein CF70_009000 [Cupriavidus sp. SK-3]